VSIGRDTMVDHYRVQRPIGTGAYATVYLAHDDRLDARVALKVLAENRSLDLEVRRRFVEEAQKLRKVSSDAVVTVFDVGETANHQPYMVLDHADRGDLAARRAALPTAQLDAASIQQVIDFLCRSLSALHEVGLVHRDVKPQNVLIKSTAEQSRSAAAAAANQLVGSDEMLLLGDLGFAKDLDAASGLTVGGGTEAYQPPEQAHAFGTVDRRADIYAASALVAWLHTGAVPAPGQTWLDALQHAPVSPQIMVALQQGLAHNPDQRHQSMQQWRDSLSTTPDPAASIATQSQAAALTRGSRPLLAGVAAVAALVAVSFGAGWLLQDSTAEPTTEIVDGFSRTTATVGIHEVVIQGPADVAVDERATFTASITPAAPGSWVRPEGGLTSAETAMTFTAVSPGQFTVALLVAPPGSEPELVPPSTMRRLDYLAASDRGSTGVSSTFAPCLPMSVASPQLPGWFQWTKWFAHTSAGNFSSHERDKPGMNNNNHFNKRPFYAAILAIAMLLASCGSAEPELAEVISEPALATDAADLTDAEDALDAAAQLLEDAGSAGDDGLASAEEALEEAERLLEDADDALSSASNGVSETAEQALAQLEDAGLLDDDDGPTDDGAPQDVAAGSSLPEDIEVQFVDLPLVPAITLPDLSVLGAAGALVDDQLTDAVAGNSGLDVVGAECGSDNSEFVYQGDDGRGTFFDVETDGSGVYSSDGITITVNADGSGTFIDASPAQDIEINVNADGSGTYRDNSAATDLSITVQPDGSGVYVNQAVEIQIRPDGSGFLQDESAATSIRLDVNGDGTGRFEDQGPATAIVLESNADGGWTFSDGSSSTNIALTVNPDGSGSFRDTSAATDIAITVDSDGNGTYIDQGPATDLELTFTTDIGILDPNLIVAGPMPVFAVADQFPPLASLGRFDPPCATVIRLDAGVLFDFDSAQLRPAAEPVIDEVADALRAAGKSVEVHGHTDSKGSDDYNLDLSVRRANSFADALRSRGVTSDIAIEGFGETRPLAPNTNDDGSDNPGGRQLNRRIEIVIAE